MPNRRGIFIILTIIFSAGVTPIVIRITQNEGMPSLVIVLIRLWLISLALLPLIWTRYRSDLLNLTRRQWFLSSVAGFWLAVNLFMLFMSLEYTSVLMTSVLRRITPIWIVLPEILLFGAVFSRRFRIGLALTLIGVVMVGLGGLTAIQGGSDPLLGAVMASFGSLCFGIYLLIGRQLNNVIPPILYSFVVFFSSAVVTTVFVGITHTPGPRLSSQWLSLVRGCDAAGAGVRASLPESGAANVHGDGDGDCPANRRRPKRGDGAVPVWRTSFVFADHWQRPGHLWRRRGDA